MDVSNTYSQRIFLDNINYNFSEQELQKLKNDLQITFPVSLIIFFLLISKIPLTLACSAAAMHATKGIPPCFKELG